MLIVSAILVPSCLESRDVVTREEYDELLDRVEALERIAQHIAIVDGNVVISGANLIIQNGSGATETDNPSAPATGNLIIGYKEAVGDESRTGWHNLIIGRYNDWQSYGGLVAGEDNTIAAPASTVSGGMSGTATGHYGAIVGGQGTWAEAEYSAVVGGLHSAADGDYAVVVGGRDSRATGEQSVSVGGAICNTTTETEVCLE